MPPKKARNPEDESTIISSGVDVRNLRQYDVAYDLQYLLSGLPPSTNGRPTTGKRRSACKHTDRQGCIDRDHEEHYRLRQLPRQQVRSTAHTNARFPSDKFTPSANDRAVLGNHKTIKPEDVLEALKDTEFEQFIPRVKSEHDTFVQIANDKRNDYRKKLKEDTQAKGDVNPDNTMSAEGHGEAGDSTLSDHSPGVADGKYRSDDEPPAAKRPRMSLGDRQSMTGDSRNQDGVDEEDIDATEPEEPEDEIEEDEEEDFGEPAKAQGEQDDDMDGGVELDDSNAYNRRDADDESEDGY